jgi:hypothetical protein
VKLNRCFKTGRNQIFLSASKAQAHIFKHYIKAFAADVCGVELTGDPIVLSNGAELLFLGTNYRTAQGHHGNFYFDEFFWTHGFNELEKLHRQWLCRRNGVKPIFLLHQPLLMKRIHFGLVNVSIKVVQKQTS